MVEVGLDRFGDEGEDVARLLSARLDDREDRFDDPAPRGALGPERQFSPDHRVTQAAFTGVVGRLDLLNIKERPKPLPMIIEFPAHADEPWIAAARSAQQQASHLLADRMHQPLQSGPGDRPVPRACPQAEQFPA